MKILIPYIEKKRILLHEKKKKKHDIKSISKMIETISLKSKEKSPFYY